MTDLPDTLLVGAGDLGTEIGLRLGAAGHGVVAIRRRGGLVPSPLTGVSGDIREGLPALPEFAGVAGGPRSLVVCLTAGGREESAYREVFLEGVGRVLAAVRERGWVPERAVFVSSTGVCAQHGMVTEDTPAEPSSPTSRVLLEAEERFAAGLPEDTASVVVRPSGLYGPGREWFIDQARRGEVKNPDRMTHRVHRDDVAGAVVHLLMMAAAPEPLYLVTDEAPAPAGEVARFLAEELGVAPPCHEVEFSSATGTTPTQARRIDNGRLLSTGFTFAYPSYREGYRAVLAGSGTRHP